MNDRFATWEEANAYAQSRADKEKRSFGIEILKSPLEPGRDWLVRSIPAKKFRFGCDARCEAVEPSRWEDVPVDSKNAPRGQTCPTCNVTDSTFLESIHGAIYYRCDNCRREFYG